MSTVVTVVTVVEKSKILVVLDEDAFSNIDKFHDGSENIDEDDVSDESADVAEEDWAGLDWISRRDDVAKNSGPFLR